MEPRTVVRSGRKEIGSNRLKHEAQAARRIGGGMNSELFALPPAESLEQDERYTTRETMIWCAKLACVDVWHLDAAACEESHKAEKFFTVADDGLTRSWFGNTWVNPPYSDIAPWVSKAWLEMKSLPGPDVIAMLIPASRTEQRWWQEDVEAWRDRAHRRAGVRLSTHFLPGRTRFGHPGNPEGVGVGSPPFGCVLLVWRRA